MFPSFSSSSSTLPLKTKVEGYTLRAEGCWQESYDTTIILEKTMVGPWNKEVDGGCMAKLLGEWKQ